MILFGIYFLFLIFENLLMPALVGPEFFLITPIFLLAVIVNSSNFKKALSELLIFGLIGELFIGTQIGSSLIPLLLTALIYFGIDHFIEMRSGLDSIASFPVILGRSFVLTCLSYIYSWLFIFIKSSYSIYATWSAFNIFIDLSSIVTIFVWSCIFSLIFAYVLKTK